MENVEVYDNECSYDRYSVVVGKAVYGMSHNPLHPQGFNQYIGETHEFKHLGRKVDLSTLPQQVQQAIQERL